MRDIFGFSPHDYQTLRVFEKRGILQQQLQARCAAFAELKEVPREQAMVPHKFYQGNELAYQLQASGAQGFMTNNFQAFTSMTDEIWYREFRLNDYVPVITGGVPEGADTFAIRVRDRRGRGRIGPRYDGNVPTADTNLRKYSAQLYLGMIDAIYTDEDMRNSLYINQPLQKDKIAAAVEGANNHIEIAGIEGDPDIPNATGLVNQPTSGTTATASRILPSSTLSPTLEATDAWMAFTSQEKVDTLQYMISKIVTDTNEIIVQRGKQGKCEMVVALPPILFDLTCQQPFGDNNDKTVKDYVDRANSWKARTGKDVMWKSIVELKDAGTPVEAGGNNTTNRIAVYVKDEEVMEFRLVFSPRLTRVVQEARATVLPYEYKFSELQVKRGSCIVYLDDV